jgi:hypothetical protein
MFGERSFDGASGRHRVAAQLRRRRRDERRGGARGGDREGGGARGCGSKDADRHLARAPVGAPSIPGAFLLLRVGRRDAIASSSEYRGEADVEVESATHRGGEVERSRGEACARGGTGVAVVTVAVARVVAVAFLPPRSFVRGPPPLGGDESADAGSVSGRASDLDEVARARAERAEGVRVRAHLGVDVARAGVERRVRVRAEGDQRRGEGRDATRRGRARDRQGRFRGRGGGGRGGRGVAGVGGDDARPRRGEVGGERRGLGEDDQGSARVRRRGRDGRGGDDGRGDDDHRLRPRVARRRAREEDGAEGRNSARTETTIAMTREFHDNLVFVAVSARVVGPDDTTTRARSSAALGARHRSRMRSHAEG